MHVFSRVFLFFAGRKIRWTTQFFCAALAAPLFAAGINEEIDHLLQFVEHTQCQYERNGKMHSGREAAEHIKKKYNYFKNDIQSAERFIELSATKSTLSGKFYLVHCPGHPPIRSQLWLLRELENYRNGGAG